MFVPGLEMNPTDGKKKRLRSQVLIKQSIQNQERFKSTCNLIESETMLGETDVLEHKRQRFVQQVEIGFLIRMRMQALHWNILGCLFI